MVKLFLSGGGDEKQTKNFDGVFAKSIPNPKRILYIPIAMPRTKFTECFNWINKSLNSLGIDNIDMWTNIHNKNISELEKYDAIYIGGGNTFSLLNKLKKSGFDKLLEKYVQNGKIIYGGSAGAIILGRDIQTAGFGRDSDKNIVSLKNFDGLNLIKNYSIQCHYFPEEKELMKRFAEKNKFQIIALPEETGIYLKNNLIKIIGEKNAFLFTPTKIKTLKINSTFKI